MNLTIAATELPPLRRSAAAGVVAVAHLGLLAALAFGGITRSPVKRFPQAGVMMMLPAMVEGDHHTTSASSAPARPHIGDAAPQAAGPPSIDQVASVEGESGEGADSQSVAASTVFFSNAEPAPAPAPSPNAGCRCAKPALAPVEDPACPDSIVHVKCSD